MALFGVLSMIDTPFVLDGYFRSDFWDVVTSVLIVLLFVELNLLGIRQFTLFKRLYMHLITVFVILLSLISNDRMYYVLILMWVFVSSGCFIYDYMKQYRDTKTEYPRDRMFYIHAMSILFIVFPLTDLTIIQDGTMALVSLGVGLFVCVVAVIFMLILKINLKQNLELTVSMFFIVPLLFFLLIAGLNYALDDSISETHVYEIIDLEVDSGPRTPTTYEVYFEIDGKREHIGVDEDLYYELEIGDDISVSIYDGFFGFEYLIHE